MVKKKPPAPRQGDASLLDWAQLARILETDPSGVAVVSASGDVQFVNAAAERLAGLRAGQHYSEGTARMTRTDGRPLGDEERPFTRVLRSGRAVSDVEIAVARADGVRLILSVSAAPMFDAEGRPAAVVASFSDVTGNRQAEEAVRASEARLRAAERVAQLGHWIVEHPREETIWSEETYRIYGVSPDSFQPSPASLLALLVPDDRPVLQEWIRAVLAGESPGEHTLRVRRPDGTERIVLGRGRLEVDDAGQPVRVFGTVLDITDRERAEEALRASEVRLASILATTPSGILLIDASGVITYANQAAERLAGLSPHSMASRRYDSPGWQFITPDGRPLPDEERLFRRVLRTRQPIYDAETTVRLSNGRIVELSGSAALLSDADDATSGIVATFTDITERKRVEAELHETHDRLAKIIGTTPGVVCSVRMRPDGSTYFPYGAERVGEFCGLAPGVLAEDTSALFLQSHPDDVGRLRETLAESARALTPFRCEWRVRNPVRGEIWIEAHSLPLREPDGSILWHGVTTDITERKHAEIALRQSEERLRLALDAARMGTFDWDIPHDRITWNRRHEELWSFAPGEFEGTYEAFACRVRHDDLPGVSEEIARCIAAREPFVREFRVVWPDGSVHWIAARGEFSFDADGRPSRMLGAVVEVTARKRTEEALRESSERLARIIATDASGIVVVDRSGTITLANPAVERMAGVPPGSMAGRPAPEVAPLLLRTLDGKPLAEDERPFRVALSTGRPVQDMEVALQRPDGRRIVLSVNAAPLLNEDGTPSAVVATLTDITERKRAEAQIRESAAALRALSARLQTAREEEATRIARELHDELGQALTAVKMDLSWVDKRLAAAADTPEAAALRGKTAAMAGQIDETIGLVRRLATELRPGLLDDLGLAAAIEWQAQEFQARTGITCTASIAADVAAIEPSRATALYRILQEALTNVVRHAAAQRVAITLTAEAGSLCLEVRDDGCGIDQEHRPSSRSLGLLGMQERARAVGGDVRVTRAEPRGTVVEARIPLA